MKRRAFVSGAVVTTLGCVLDLLGAHASAVASGTARSDSSNKDSTGDLLEFWPSRLNVFRASLLKGPGFSLQYGGRPGVIESVSEHTSGTLAETTFRYSGNLEVIRRLTRLPDNDAIEYSLRIRNSGQSRSAPIQNVNSLSVSFGASALRGAFVVSSAGGLNDGVYPPNAFTIKEQHFNPTLPSRGIVTLTTDGGRSSNRDLPFYFVHNGEERAGIYVAMGWTGQWVSTIAADYGKTFGAEPELQLRGGIPNIRIELDPGEEIGGPTILIGSYDGSVADGSNRLRRLLRTQYTPKLDGADFGVIATYDTWYGIREKYDEALLRPLVDAAVEIGQEYFLLDAAWYAGGSGPEGFVAGDGNWEQVDTAKFPAGLAPFAHYVQSRGLKFGLWFEPERVHRSSLLGMQHPEWVIWLDGEDHGLLDYGRAEVQEWVQNMMSDYITRLGIEYIRHDFNMDPLIYWDAVDKPNRRGVSQIRYIEGLNSVIDWIRQRHPRTVLECCASGGRRIDLETARRFHTYWISDDTVDPVNVRYHLQGINYFLPGNYNYIQYTLPAPAQKEFTGNDINYLSLFGGALGAGGRIDLWSAAQRQRFALMAGIHKTLGHYLMEEYYPLLPQPLDLNGWAAWQFHDPKSHSGFIQVFRDGSELSTMRIAARGLRVQDTYEFRDVLTGVVVRETGHNVMKDGLRCHLAMMSSQILLYHTAEHASLYSACPSLS